MGTVKLFEVAKNLSSLKNILIFTSDKVYKNFEVKRGYKENDIIGGQDPYSASKASIEIMVKAYRESFFKNLMDVNYHGAVNCVHAALPHLKESSGKIISCSTAQALMGFPSHSGYAASKQHFKVHIEDGIKNDLRRVWVCITWIQ